MNTTDAKQPEPSNEAEREAGFAGAHGSATVIELSGNETDERCRDIAWQMFCNAHPVEAYQHNTDGFWKYFHARAPDMTREQMVALLKECEEPERESPNVKLTNPAAE
jgi:hypothetical protein